jgi:hypothetical protein
VGNPRGENDIRCGELRVGESSARRREKADQRPGTLPSPDDQVFRVGVAIGRDAGVGPIAWGLFAVSDNHDLGGSNRRISSGARLETIGSRSQFARLPRRTPFQFLLDLPIDTVNREITQSISRSPEKYLVVSKNLNAPHATKPTALVRRPRSGTSRSVLGRFGLLS